MANRIFTFWEPVENMPDYISLCIETWKKFLPEYEIVLLDYKNLDNWLGKNYYDSILYEEFSLPKQADAIRCALLNRYGGIWLDADTIITSRKFKNLLNNNSDFILLGKHIGFIMANSNSKILLKWQEEIFKKLKYYKKSRHFINLYRIFNRTKYKQLKNWNYLGNGILDKHLDIANSKDFCSIDVYLNNILPEKSKNNNLDLSPSLLYQNFYFNNNYSLDFLENNCGIILLHNSWTPNKYKQMDKKEFLKQEITLAKLFKYLLIDENGDKLCEE